MGGLKRPGGIRLGYTPACQLSNSPVNPQQKRGGFLGVAGNSRCSRILRFGFGSQRIRTELGSAPKIRGVEELGNRFAIFPDLGLWELAKSKVPERAICPGAEADQFLLVTDALQTKLPDLFKGRRPWQTPIVQVSYCL